MMHRFLRYPHLGFLFTLLVLIAASFFAIYSATYALQMEQFILKHSIFVFMGLILFVFLSLSQKHLFKDFAIGLYIINVFLLLTINILQWANYIEKPARWIEIGGITFQPSELMKITLILILSWIFSQRQFSALKMFLLSGLATLIPVILILLQPDLGTAVILGAIFIVLCFVARPGLSYVFLTFLSGFLLFFPFRKYVLHEYQLHRLMTFLNPASDPMGEGWSINQALIAVGSGGLWGKGYLQGTQSKMGFLPDTQYSDFIFAVIAEEWGFMGSIALVLIFLTFFSICYSIMLKTSDFFSKLVIWGILGYWSIQTITNIGMNIGLMPVTGVPLPFISYGGTALLANLIAAGLLYNIHLHQKSVSY